MSPYRTARPYVIVALWIICVLVGTVVRVAIVASWGVWTPDGRLAVDPLLYAASMAIDLSVAGGLYLWLVNAFAPPP